MFAKAFELYDKLLNKCKTQNDKNIKAKNIPENLTIDLYLDEDKCDLPQILPIEGDEEVKEGKRLKILTPNKFLTRLRILLAQIKAGINSYKLKN